jgi:hypothetical protein
MERKVNLGDPDFEPTDEELIELAHRAFADVPRANDAAQAKLRADIAALREEALRQVARWLPSTA